MVSEWWPQPGLAVAQLLHDSWESGHWNSKHTTFLKVSFHHLHQCFGHSGPWSQKQHQSLQCMESWWTSASQLPSSHQKSECSSIQTSASFYPALLAASSDWNIDEIRKNTAASVKMLLWFKEILLNINDLGGEENARAPLHMFDSACRFVCSSTLDCVLHRIWRELTSITSALCRASWWDSAYSPCRILTLQVLQVIINTINWALDLRLRAYADEGTVFFLSPGRKGGFLPLATFL